jgi:hypothetical protein
MKLEYSEIISRLNERADSIAHDLLGDPKRQGPRIYGDVFGTCSVVISGPKTGLVGFWQGQRDDRQGGNLIDLIEVAMAFSNHGEAVRYAKSHYLGIPERDFTPEEKRAWAKKQEELRAKSDQRRKQDEANRNKRISDVQSRWKEAKPIKGTLADKYLTNRICERDWPPTLKFHPAFPLEMDGDKPHPCLVAAVQASDRKLVSLWRIYLNPDGSNLIRNDQKVKMGFGPSAGGVVRLTHAKGLWRVGEGIESTLGAWALAGWKGNWAASLSTSGMRGFEIPEGVLGVSLYSDGDLSRLKGDKLIDPPGQSAARAKQKQIQEIGLGCSINEPPEMSDWADVWETVRNG